MPPVEQGEERRIQITEFSQEGNGIGYINGFVIVVPDGGIGQWITVTIDAVYDNFALASVSEKEPDLIFDSPVGE